MTVILLKTGFVLTAFYELLFRVFPYIGSFSPDTRIAKTFIGMWLALAIGLSAVFEGRIRECKNKWLLMFMVFIPLSIHLAPQYNIEVNGVDSPNYWVWKPFVLILCYFLMFLGVQSMNITKESLKGIFNVSVWCGVVMAGYMLLQNLGWEQFFIPKTGDAFLEVTKPVTVGTLGQSTIVSPYIAMIIPFALYCRRYVAVGVLICAVLVSHSTMAIGAMVGSLCVYSCLRWKMRGVFVVYLACVLSALVLGGISVYNPPQFKEIKDKVLNVSGRMAVWKNTIKATKEAELGGTVKTRHPYTGTGIGSYSVIIQPLLKSTYDKAHNEYIEILCTMGILGLFLFLAAVGYMLKGVFIAYFKGFNRNELAVLFCSFLCIAVVAFGSFPWQIAPTIFYTVLVVGLLSNRKILKGEFQ